MRREQHGHVIVVRRLAGLSAALLAASAWAGPSTGLVPLTELGSALYQGHPGGLYPGGGNVPPAAHRNAAHEAARRIVPRDPGGAPSAAGLIGWISVGMSNTTQEFKVFERDQDANLLRNARVVLVNGAVGGVSSQEWRDPSHPVWATLEQRVRATGLTPEQVQVVWLKHAQAAPPTTAFPQHALNLEDDLRAVVRNLQDRYPNAALCFLSSRIYGGWTDRVDRGEPLSYETAFAVRWLIEDQIAGDPELNCDPARGSVEAPLLLWGPYLWADGVAARADGLTWLREDLDTDAVHPGPTGERKVADLLGQFFATEPVARPWWGFADDTDLVVIAASADASVDSGTPGVNTGSLTYLRSVAGATTGRAFVRFDASAIGSAAILFAKLSLRTLSEANGALRSAADVSWTENGITWSNAPPLEAGSLGAIARWSPDSSMSHDVTAYLTSDADRLVTLVIEGTDATVRRWQARESGEPPRLVLTVPTSRITIRLEKSPATSGVAIRWNDNGAAPFTVRRALGPAPADFAVAVEAPAAGTTHDDPGALGAPESYFYLVD